jgi:hypothetical protein
MEQTHLKQISSAQLERQPNGVALFSCIRNERDRLPYFLEYYRQIGVDTFYFVDNGSEDGTTQYLQRQHDCNVFWTTASYASANCGVDWMNELLDAYSQGEWALVVDADELLVYLDVESVRLTSFVTELEGQGADAFCTFMLDMYPEGPLEDARYKRGQNFIEVCPYFDRSGYDYGFKDLPAFGGVRSRLFWKGKTYKKKPPYLQKVPLIKWHQERKFTASTHAIENVRFAESTGVLLHFKLFSDFVQRVEAEIDRKEHWKEASEYQIYWSGLQDQPHLDPVCDISEKYVSSRQLAQLGMILGSKLDH